MCGSIKFNVFVDTYTSISLLYSTHDFTFLFTRIELEIIIHIGSKLLDAFTITRIYYHTAGQATGSLRNLRCDHTFLYRLDMNDVTFLFFSLLCCCVCFCGCLVVVVFLFVRMKKEKRYFAQHCNTRCSCGCMDFWIVWFE